MAGKTLFTIPIPPLNQHVGGSVTVSEPAPAVYLLTITSPPDNRLTTASCTAILDALDLIEFGGFTPGVVITTSGIQKFFSNGLDLEHAISTKTFIPGVLYKLFNRFLTYPMPTIALLPGHAFAGGLMLAMHHDYRVMNPSRGFACVNELEFGVPLKAPMSSIFRLKLPAATYRDLVLEAKRFSGEEAVRGGLVDRVGGLEEVLQLVRERKLTDKAKTGIYGLLKTEMYRESVAFLTQAGYDREEEKDRLMIENEDKRKGEAEAKLGAIKEKAKL
ncbi:ClpP/crotonase-like domain-containing protein [Triangularia verruculosa]|uniref:ClpP/crotonase-like domain-containing protein n=1 Tax=Triangularia verruculosa TaxID=2587418 RepID=A0AAN6XRV8_9PEZI|nr:ClpP/crotonase-like domain-containing protein [Triangularia verruculosa]